MSDPRDLKAAAEFCLSLLPRRTYQSLAGALKVQTFLQCLSPQFTVNIDLGDFVNPLPGPPSPKAGPNFFY